MVNINQLSSNTDDLRDAIAGSWGTEITDNYKISYIGKLVIAEGNKEDIENNLKKKVYNLINIKDNIYLGFIEE